MLTLQNILESDSIATVVAKMNANFQAIALANGGPQGIRGEQGIPGLPGKQGPSGPSGPIGETGPGPGLIPFSNLIQSVSSVGGIDQPQDSYDFLTTASSWAPDNPLDGQIWFDNNQLGWWKYLMQADPSTSDPNVGNFLETGPYSSGGYTGPGWYFYPMNFSSIIGSLQSTWASDPTNYLGLIGAAYGSPSASPNLTSYAPYGIPNARMSSKFGNVWITSGDKATGQPGPGGDTSSNDTSLIHYWDYVNNTRLNSGIDRSLFKMSIDGVTYYNGLKARGWRNTDTGDIVGPPYTVNGGTTDVPTGLPYSTFPGTVGGNSDYFARPIYDISIDAYSPLLFLSNRDLESEGGTTGSLGYYQWSSGNNSIKIHNFSTREGIDDFFTSEGGVTSSENYGEMLFDVRRFITSNQYLNMLPQDTPAFTSLQTLTPGGNTSPFNTTNPGNVYDELGSSNQYLAFQGYHSLFTGQKIIDQSASGSQVDITSISDWIYDKRQSWYGTSIYEEEVVLANSGGTKELVRSAGMMVRGTSTGTAGLTISVDNVLFYSANQRGATNYASGNDPAANGLRSLPVSAVYGSRNFGIGTVTMDKVGIFQPLAKLQVHNDWRPAIETWDTNTTFTEEITTGINFYTGIDKSWLTYTDYIPKRRMKTAAFTIERSSPELIYGTTSGFAPWNQSPFGSPDAAWVDWYDRGVFNDVLFGAVDVDYKENADDQFQLSRIAPSTGIRYESFNYTQTPSRPYSMDNRSGGWGFKGALRLGASPIYGGGSSATSGDTYTIGDNAALQNVDYQFNLVPLSFGPYANIGARDADAGISAVSGIGIHNLYPRARFHMYGKNSYQEFRFDEARTPGTVEIDTIGNVTRGTWPALPSDGQIVIDQILSTYTYNAAIFDYSYDLLTTPASASITWTTKVTPNSVNYPYKEAARSNATTLIVGDTLYTSNSTLNVGSLNSERGTTGQFGKSSWHGGYNNGIWTSSRYVGFNLFRDLLGIGDNRGSDDGDYINDTTGYSQSVDASAWRLGTESVARDNSNSANELQAANGGSAILTDTDGRIGFAMIPKWRDGGAYYGQWEQTGLGTRDVTNNIKVVFDETGNVGIGNAAGYDQNAYASQKWNSATGEINYLPNAAGSNPNPSENPPASYSSGPGQVKAGPWSPGTSDYYGLFLPNSYTYGSALAPQDVNKWATSPEYIRLEVAGEKAQSRVGHHIEARGFGYPGWAVASTGLPTGSGATVVITDSNAKFANRYIGVPTGTSGWNTATHTFTFDNLGRLVSYVITGLGTMTGDLLESYPEAILPHPSEFGEGGPFAPGATSTTHPWIADLTISRTFNGTSWTGGQVLVPLGSAAGKLGSLIAIPSGYIGATATATFATEDLVPANVRLNNFVLGDGYEFIRSTNDVLAWQNITDVTETATKAIYDARVTSPKLLLTFGAPDYFNMENSMFLSSTQINSLVATGKAPLMKVTTAIDSAQTDSSLRTYTIPKADNTGGTFLVVTDHMGDREQDNPGLASVPQNTAKSRIKVDRIIAYEVQRTAPGAAGGGTFTPITTASFGYELVGIHYYDGLSPADPKYPGNGVESLYYPNTSSEATGSQASVEMRRKLSAYWELNTGTYSSRWNDENGDPITYSRTDVRYRRLNSNYLLFDFNIDLEALDYMQMNDGSPWNSPGDRYFGENWGEAGNEDLDYYVHNPYSAGIYANSLINKGSICGNTWLGIDGRWIQYVRFIYDIGEDVLFAGDEDNDENYYEYQYGGGANFGNWNDYRAWYPGTAVVGDSTDDMTNFIDTTYTPGWIASTDGSPYTRFPIDGSTKFSTPSATSDPSTNSFLNKSWNGAFKDWYWSTHTNTVSNFLPYTNDSLLGSLTTADVRNHPWIFTDPDVMEASIDRGLFRKSNINAIGYKNLQKGWYQALWSPDGAGAAGISGGDFIYTKIEVPDYYDAAVWRTFGENAWNRNASFQWRATPYYYGGDTVAEPQGLINSFVIEIMFDQPIYVSGARRVAHRNVSTTGFYEPVSIQNLYYRPSYDTTPGTPIYDFSIEPALPGGEILPLSPTEVADHSSGQNNFYTGNSVKGEFGPATFKPFGNITLRGQAMLKYQKVYGTPRT
jgi:hypothetical protein